MLHDLILGQLGDEACQEWRNALPGSGHYPRVPRSPCALPCYGLFFRGSLGLAALAASAWAMTNLSASCSLGNSLTDRKVCCFSVVKVFQSSGLMTSWAIMPGFPGRVATRQIILPPGAGARMHVF